jgi:hypothetical protein
MLVEVNGEKFANVYGLSELRLLNFAIKNHGMNIAISVNNTKLFKK